MTGQRNNRLILQFVLILIVLTTYSSTSTIAQLKRGDTFTVTAVEKTINHPFYGQGDSDSAFAIDGEEGKQLTLVRGVTYTFQMNDVPKLFEFYIVQHPEGNGAPEWLQGVSKNFIEGNDIMTFTPPEEVPDTLYYGSGGRSYIGGLIEVVDEEPTNSIYENNMKIATSYLEGSAAPNPFHSSTEISFDLESSSSVAMEIVDVVGRVVYSSEAEWMEAGRRTVTVRGENLPSGVLLYRITALAGERRKIFTGRIVRE